MEALEVSREKRVFERVLKAQKEAIEKQRLEELKKQTVSNTKIGIKRGNSFI